MLWTSQEATDTNIRPGTCGSINGTIRCQHTFPNTFNITAATITDIMPSNSSNASLTYAKQYEQYTSTTFLSHTRVHHLSEAVCALLITSVILNFFCLLLGFLADISEPRSGKVRILFLIVLLDSCAQCAAVLIVYLIIRNALTGAHAGFLGINSMHSPVGYELGFWLVVVAAASQLLSASIIAFSSKQAEKEPDQQPRDHELQEQQFPDQRWRDQRRQDHQVQDQRRQDQRRQLQRWQDHGERLNQIRIPKSFRDADNVDDVFYDSLVSKIASTIKGLRQAVETYLDQERIDESCKTLFTTTRDDGELASLIASHFYQKSATLFLGMHSEATGNSSGPLLYQSCSCPYHECTKAPNSGSRGVYLVIVRECCYGSRLPIDTREYMYVGSGQSAEGVMLRVEEHTNYTYRKSQRSELYKAWDRLVSNPFVSIYQLAEWDPLPVSRTHRDADVYAEILLAEAIWQVVLQTSAPVNMSDFTEHIQEQGYGSFDLISNVWTGCNVISALEDVKTRPQRSRYAN